MNPFFFSKGSKTKKNNPAGNGGNTTTVSGAATTGKSYWQPGTAAASPTSSILGGGAGNTTGKNNVATAVSIAPTATVAGTSSKSKKGWWRRKQKTVNTATSFGAGAVGSPINKRRFISLRKLLLIGLPIFVLVVVAVILGLGLVSGNGGSPILNFGGDNTAAVLNLSSSPVGAAVTLNGNSVGSTPLKLNLNAGKAEIILKKDGYTGYEVDLQVKPAAANTGKPLPSYNLSPALWPTKPTLTRLPQPIPNSQLDYVRYLADPNKLELTEVGSDGNPLSAGAEGLPTNLWLYNRAITTTQEIHPVDIDYSTLNAIENYYATGSLVVSTTPTISTTNTIITTAASLKVTLGQMIFTAPTLDPSGSNLAFVSKSPFGGSNVLDSQTLATLKPSQLNETLWVKQVGAEPSPGGVLLTLSQNQAPVIPLFSTSQLTQLLPSLIPSAALTTTQQLNSQQQQSLQYVAHIDELSWSPAGDKLLAVINMVLPSATAGNNSGGSNGNQVTVLVEIGFGHGYPPGLAWVVTPQPLPLAILPGTIAWSPDANSVAFLVQRDNSAAGQQYQNATSLCVLDLDFAAHLDSQNSGNPGNTRYSATATPLRYIADVTGGGAWGQAINYNTGINLVGGHVYPQAYGSVRYAPFSWPQVQSLEAASIKGTGANSVFAAAAPSWAIGAGAPFDTMFSYNGSVDTVGKVITSLKPLLDLGQPSSPASGGIATKGKDSSTSFRQDSYPFWQQGDHPIYLSSQLGTPSKTLNSGSSGGGGSNAGALQLTVRQLPVADFAVLNFGGNSNTQQPGQIEVLKELHGSLALPPFDGYGSSSANSSTGVNVASQFEAQWQPDGRGFLLALPSGSYNGGAVLWLVSW